MGTPAGGMPPDKTGTYAGFGNVALLHEVRHALPPGGSVCDLGCASGGLLAGLADLAGSRTGVDLDADAVRAAMAVADHTLVADVATLSHLPPGGPFDVVVCGDVLEHVPTPRDVLERVSGWLTPSGQVVISVPNIAYVQARWRLLRGTWRYEPSGIFDDTHLRFFTRDTIVELVQEAGLDVDLVAPVIPALRNHIHVLDRLPRRVVRVVERLWRAVARRQQGLFSYQFIVVAHVPGGARTIPNEQVDAG